MKSRGVDETQPVTGDHLLDGPAGRSVLGSAVEVAAQSQRQLSGLRSSHVHLAIAQRSSHPYAVDFDEYTCLNPRLL